MSNQTSNKFITFSYVVYLRSVLPHNFAHFSSILMQNLRRIILRVINIVKLSLDGYALHCTMIISSATPKSPNELV